MSFNNVQEVECSVMEFPMAAVSISAGDIVVLDTGYLDVGSEATGLLAVGIAQKTIDNSGGSPGDTVMPVSLGYGPKGIRIHFLLNSANDPIAAADVGDDCYIEDGSTVSLDSTGTSKAGRIMRIRASDGKIGVWFNQ